jgi:hypothetical protein
MMEFNGNAYKGVYNGWKSDAGNTNSSGAAKLAGIKICLEYEKPDDKKKKSVGRGDTASKVYNIMMGI